MVYSRFEQCFKHQLCKQKQHDLPPRPLDCCESPMWHEYGFGKWSDDQWLGSLILLDVIGCYWKDNVTDWMLENPQCATLWLLDVVGDYALIHMNGKPINQVVEWNGIRIGLFEWLRLVKLLIVDVWIVVRWHTSQQSNQILPSFKPEGRGKHVLHSPIRRFHQW